MNTPHCSRVGNFARRSAFLFALCLLFALGACVKGGPKDGGEPANPNEKRLAYGLSVNVPAGWTVVSSVGPEAGTKEALDARRKNGDRVLLLETTGTAGPRGFQPFISVVLTNEEGSFLPREVAEKLTPEEFAAMSKNMMAREKAMAKKNKTKSELLDMQFSRDNLGGNLAVMQRLLLAGPDGKPVRLMGWDIYLPNGAGVMIRSGCDPEMPNAEGEIINIAKSFRAR